MWEHMLKSLKDNATINRANAYVSFLQVVGNQAMNPPLLHILPISLAPSTALIWTTALAP